ncbi:MAG TPA: YceI family protein [Candidatus Sulfotelmatobacter sp.]
MPATEPLLKHATTHYFIDAKASTFVAQVFATGLLASFGHNPRIAIQAFQGELSFSLTGSIIENARLRIGIPADALEVADDISEKDRSEIHRKMTQEALETDRFPEIVYQCSRLSASGGGDRYWVALNGELTLHGVTRALPVSARAVINGNSVRASGTFSIRQSEYEIPAVTAAAGAIRLKDEVKCTFDVIARKQE